MNKRKPTNVLTVIRTGTGDTGYTNFGSNLVSKTAIDIKYLGALDTIQSSAIELYAVQDLIFALGAHHTNPSANKYTDQIVYLTKQFETCIRLYTTQVPPLSGFIRTNHDNYYLMQLRTAIRNAEIIACECFELGSEYAHLDIHKVALNVLSDFIFVGIMKHSSIDREFDWTGDQPLHNPITDLMRLITVSTTTP